MRRFFVRLWCRVAAVVAAVSVLVAPTAQAQAPGLELGSPKDATGATDATDVAGTAVQTCPEVVVLAARGSEQNDPEHVRPTEYGVNPGWVSSGYEGPATRGLLLATEKRHYDRTGQSLMADIPVVSLGPEIYPAALPLPAIADTDEEIGVLETLLRIWKILDETPPHELLIEAGVGAVDGMRSAIEQTPELLADAETRTGCTPDYLLIGYSQGAVVLTALEQQLAAEGRLRGVVYMGNPLLKPGDPATMSAHPVSGGMLRFLDLPALKPAASVPRINYCVTDDAVCDTTAETAQLALRTGLERHTRYFNESAPAPGTDAEIAAQVADSTAKMLSGPVY